MNSITTDLILQHERAAIELVTNSLTNEHTKLAYAKALTDFFKWRETRQWRILSWRSIW